MAIMGFNAGAELAQLRTQQTLAMQAAAPATAPGAASTAATAAGAAAPTGPTADAAMAGAAVQAPPSTSKIVLQAVLKGAMSGASVALGIKQFGPLLGNVPFLAKAFGSLPSAAVAASAGAAGAAATAATAATAGTGVLGFLSKLPLVGKLMPFMAKSGLAGFAIAAAIGAGIGAIGGLIKGQSDAKKAKTAYDAALAAQQQAQADAAAAAAAAAAQAPMEPQAPEQPVARNQAGGMRAKSWIISRTGSTKVTGGSFGTYKTQAGDTPLSLAKRFHTSIAEIKRLNPSMGSTIEPGMTLKLKRRVVPNAKAWVA